MGFVRTLRDGKMDVNLRAKLCNVFCLLRSTNHEQFSSPPDALTSSISQPSMFIRSRSSVWTSLSSSLRERDQSLLQVNKTRTALLSRLKAFMMWCLWNSAAFSHLLTRDRRSPSWIAPHRATERCPLSRGHFLRELPRPSFRFDPVSSSQLGVR